MTEVCDVDGVFSAIVGVACVCFSVDWGSVGVACGSDDCVYGCDGVAKVITGVTCVFGGVGVSRGGVSMR